MNFPRETMANTEKCGRRSKWISHAVTARGNCCRHHNWHFCENRNTKLTKKLKYFAQRTWAPEHRLTCTVGHHCWQNEILSRRITTLNICNNCVAFLSLLLVKNASRCHHFDGNYLHRISIVPLRVSQSEKYSSIWLALIALATLPTFDRFTEKHELNCEQETARKMIDIASISLSLSSVLLSVKMANRWSAIAVFRIHRFYMSALMPHTAVVTRRLVKMLFIVRLISVHWRLNYTRKKKKCSHFFGTNTLLIDKKRLHTCATHSRLMSPTDGQIEMYEK